MAYRRSPPAPRFNLVSEPNDWSRELARVARAIDVSELSEVKASQFEYWQAFLPVLEASGPSFVGTRTPPAQSWMNLPVGRTGLRMGTVTLRPARKVRAELYISHKHAQAFFQLLESDGALRNVERGETPGAPPEEPNE